MTFNQNQTGRRSTLRLWPGIAIVAVQCLIAYGLPAVAPDAEPFGWPIGLIGVITGLIGSIAVVGWWLFFSRAPWVERVGAVLLIVVAVAATRLLVHESIAGAGMGMLLYISALPGLGIALVIWAVLTQSLATRTRRVLLVGAIVVACAPWVLMRTSGVMGGSGSAFHWRWTPTPEERLLANADDAPSAVAVADVPATPQANPAPSEAPPPAAAVTDTAAKRTREAADAPVEATPHAMDEPASRTAPAVAETADAPAEWPGFRGASRDGVIHGSRVSTDWTASPPQELWRRPIGPGWSSFAVQGDLLYTQEQRGDDELVAAYRVSTGEPVWRHRDGVRFWESNGGAGPRATPTLHGGRVYAFGATGILNALDARSGRLLWSRNVSTEASRRVPDWGFSSSPLVVDDLVIVAASGTLAAFDLDSGVPRWIGPRLLGSYSSPHRATIDGVTQVVLLSGSGAAGVEPATGTLLWQHEWEGGGTPIVQPALIGDGEILVNTLAMTGGAGTRRISVRHAGEGWTVEERWTSNGLKPYFNDFVVHEGHAFGFDGSILSCISLEDGTRKWKGGRYGNGQMVLLPEQDLLLVMSEEGELALVSASADKFTEVARMPALNGKTWNHPVLVGDLLLVRNGEEMAAFRLSSTSVALPER